MYVPKNLIKSAARYNAEWSGMVDTYRHLEGKFCIQFPYLFSQTSVQLAMYSAISRDANGILVLICNECFNKT